MNVGIASLYFAARGNTKVVGYEPIPATYRMALDNIALNPSLSGAITPIHSGVGGSERSETVEYCEALKGSVGLLGAVGDPSVRHGILHLPVDAVIERLALRMESAISMLASIRAANDGLPVIAKIDCEGAEYEIVEALHRSGDLTSLHAVVLEWHSNGPHDLERSLMDAGSTVLSIWSNSRPWGRLFAVRGGAMSR